jgi:hypothetical protein
MLDDPALMTATHPSIGQRPLLKAAMLKSASPANLDRVIN